MSALITARGISGWPAPGWRAVKDCFAKTHRSNSRLCGCWTPPHFYLRKREPPTITVRSSWWNWLKQAGPDRHSTPETRTGTVHWQKQFHQDGQCRAGSAIATTDEIAKAETLPQGWSAQQAELWALAQALRHAEGKRVSIYTGSRYALCT